jgi:very-short-patch-repair endonuclease
MPDQPRKPYHSAPGQWEKLKPVARSMRHEPTEAEDVLWQALRNRKLDNAKFRRQYSIGRFIVDFYCAEANLVVEVDGEIHDQQVAEDQVRQNFLETQGMQVIRFRNEEVLKTIAHVLARIRETLPKR